MSNNEVEKNVIEIIRRHCRFNSDGIDLGLDLRDNFGIDSIILVEMLIEIEGMFEITIDSELLTYESFSTGSAICGYVRKNLCA